MSPKPSKLTSAVLYAVFIFGATLPNRELMRLGRSLQHLQQGAVMSDVVCLLTGLGFFALMALYARAAERL